MRREKSEFDVLGRITEERLKREWTEYTLAKNSGITQSTISSWYRNHLSPSISSLEKICNGLGITLMQFFSTSSTDPLLTDEQKEILIEWGRLNASQRLSVLQLLKSFH